MKVKDIVLLAAEMLGLAETVNGYLENGEENGARACFYPFRFS